MVTESRSAIARDLGQEAIGCRQSIRELSGESENVPNLPRAGGHAGA